MASREITLHIPTRRVPHVAVEEAIQEAGLAKSVADVSTIPVVDSPADGRGIYREGPISNGDTAPSGITVIYDREAKDLFVNIKRALIDNGIPYDEHDAGDDVDWPACVRFWRPGLTGEIAVLKAPNAIDSAFVVSSEQLERAMKVVEEEFDEVHEAEDALAILRDNISLFTLRRFPLDNYV